MYEIRIAVFVDCKLQTKCFFSVLNVKHVYYPNNVIGNVI